MTVAIPDAIANFDPRRFLAGPEQFAKRKGVDRWFRIGCLCVASLSCAILAFLLIAIFGQGIGTLSAHFLTAPPDPDATKAGFMPAIWGTVWLLLLTALIALPIGVASAVVLEEYPPKQAFLRKIHDLIELNITNLAGVPSVVYGIIGLTAFATMFGVFGSKSEPAFEMGVGYYDQYYNRATQEILLIPAPDATSPLPIPVTGTLAYTSAGKRIELNVVPTRTLPDDPELAARSVSALTKPSRMSRSSWYHFRLPFDRTILTGALTLMLVILPVLVIASQEALRAVPDSLRQAARGLGATPWQVVWQVSLPNALPGIMTASIIAMSRAIGEAAPLLMIAGIVFITSAPSNLMSDFTAMPLQIYNWAGRPQVEFHKLAASGIIVLLAVLLAFNFVAVYIRQRSRRVPS